MAQNQQTQLPQFVPEWAKPVVTAAAQKYNVPAPVLASLLQQESGYNTHAVSSAGAQGIAQFMPGTAKSYGINPFNPNQAIDAAAHYLRNSMDQFGGSVPLALASYNAGAGAVQQYGGIPPFQETQNYVKNIMAMSGQSGAQPQGQAAPQQQQQMPQQQMPQQQGTGQIPPTQINNPAGAAPMPRMGGQAGTNPSQPQQQQGQGQVPGAMQQNISNGIRQFQQRRMMPGVSPMQNSNQALSNPTSGGQQGAPMQAQQQQPTPTSYSQIISNANANSPTMASQGQTGSTGISIPTSMILQYLTGQNGGNNNQ